MKLLISGATGFIGRPLVAECLRRGYNVRAAVRAVDQVDVGYERAEMGSIDSATDWSEALADRDVVIHLAARVHITRDNVKNSLAEFRKVNVRATVNLAKQAAKAGVRRFIFISSIKVNGETTAPGQPFTADDLPAPVDPYGMSKREAEDALRALAIETGMEVVIIRPPIVYGPGVKANFYTVLRMLDRGVPLPFGAIRNQRSLVALDNLIDLITVCLDHPAAAQQIFLVSDGEDLSTTALLRRLALVLGKTPLLLPVPVAVIKCIAWLFGKSGISQRLCDSLQVDISKTQTLLNWAPPVPVDQAFRKTAQYFQDTK